MLPCCGASVLSSQNPSPNLYNQPGMPVIGSPQNAGDWLSHSHAIQQTNQNPSSPTQEQTSQNLSPQPPQQNPVPPTTDQQPNPGDGSNNNQQNNAPDESPVNNTCLLYTSPSPRDRG